MTSIATSPAHVRESWAQDLERYRKGSLLRDPSIVAVGVYRFGQWGDAQAPGVRRKLLRYAYEVLAFGSRVITGIELPKEVRSGGGLHIHHGRGLVVNSQTVIGERCTLRQGVTIGERKQDGGAPVIGDDVEFGAYSQLLGNIEVGDGAKIGAMALVLDDVPESGVAMAPKADVRFASAGVHAHKRAS